MTEVLAGRQFSAHATHYDVLEVEPGVSSAELRRAFTVAAKKYHPDRVGGADAPFKRVQAAWEVLRDDSRRKAYDESLAVGRRPRYWEEKGAGDPGSPTRKEAAARMERKQPSSVPLVAVAVVCRQGRVGATAVRRTYPANALGGLSAASLAELAELALPRGVAQPAAKSQSYVFFTVGGSSPMYGVACTGYGSAAADAFARDGAGAVAVCALSPLPLYGLLHARLAAHAAALFPGWSAEELSDDSLSQLYGSLTAPCAMGQVRADTLSLLAPFGTLLPSSLSRAR